MDDPEGDVEHDLDVHFQDEDHLQESAIFEDPEVLRELREDPITCSFRFHRFTPSGKAVWDVPLCPRCQASEETTFHQLWECPHNSNIQGTHLEFLEEAREGHLENPCLWLRGLPPLCGSTHTACRQQTSAWSLQVGGPLPRLLCPPALL